MNRKRAALASAAFVPLLLALAACAPTVALQPAADAGSPDCAAVTVRLPDEIDDDSTNTTLEERQTNAQATGAWGDPVSVVLHCGVAQPPAASTLPCPSLPGVTVDWLMDDSGSPDYVFTTYDRTPAVQVTVDYTKTSPAPVLAALDAAVSELPSNGLTCLGNEDVPVPSATPTP